MGIIKKIWQKVRFHGTSSQPLIEVRVFKDAILHNLSVHQKAYPKVELAPVLKSNAYGHGLVEVASMLDGRHLPFFMVDSFYEASSLRRANIKTKILILGYVRAGQILNNTLKDCSFGIIDIEQLKIIGSKLAKPQAFHLKIDTGMHRQGILPKQADEAIKLIKGNPNFLLEGVCTHFATADSSNPSFADKQIQEWNRVAGIFRKGVPGIKYFHASNTAGAFFSPKLDANVSRLGIGLYGFNQSPFSNLDLKPALELRSIISSVKTVPAGETVGYGGTFKTLSNTEIATVPAGYNEGVDRRLSSKGCFKVGTSFCPVAGRVSMNISSIDVSQLPSVNLEQEVIIFSSNPQDKNSVENVAKLCETIPYEILVHIPQHLRRTII